MVKLRKVLREENCEEITDIVNKLRSLELNENDLKEISDTVTDRDDAVSYVEKHYSDDEGAREWAEGLPLKSSEELSSYH